LVGLEERATMLTDGLNLSDDELREFCLHVVRFLSTVAMDPHLYFEQKMSAELVGAESAVLRQRCRQLIGWVDATGLTGDQVQRLDDSLKSAGLPLFSALRQDG
jgi:hypothetical protein